MFGSSGFWLNPPPIRSLVPRKLEGTLHIIIDNFYVFKKITVPKFEIICIYTNELTGLGKLIILPLLPGTTSDTILLNKLDVLDSLSVSILSFLTIVVAIYLKRIYLKISIYLILIFVDITLTLNLLLLLESIIATSLGIRILSLIGPFSTSTLLGIVISDGFKSLLLYSERTIFSATIVISAEDTTTLFVLPSIVSIVETKLEAKFSNEFNVFCNALDAVATLLSYRYIFSKLLLIRKQEDVRNVFILSGNSY